MMLFAFSQADFLDVLAWGGLGLLALVLIFALGLVLALMGLAAGWAKRQFAVADAALVPFGKTPVGGVLHDAVAGLLPQVDEVTDPYVAAVHSALNNVVLGVVQAVLPQYTERAQKAISVEQVQRFLLYMVTGAEELLDGEAGAVPDVVSDGSTNNPKGYRAVFPPEQEYANEAGGGSEAVK